VSAFTHAFKRWTGKTPSEMRAAAYWANPSKSRWRQHWSKRGCGFDEQISGV